MSLMTPSSRWNLHWGRSTPNNCTNPRFHSRFIENRTVAQTNCPQVTESILHCVKQDCRRGGG